jgi:hypothetical protein
VVAWDRGDRGPKRGKMRGKKKKETDDAALFLLTAIDDS